MFERHLQTIHDLQQELTGRLGIAANNPEVNDLLTNARRVVHLSCREVVNFQRHGTATHETAAKLQAAVDGVMVPLSNKVAEIRKMTPGERRVLGQPRRVERPSYAAQEHQERVRQEALRDAARAGIEEAESLGGFVMEAPMVDNQYRVQLVGLSIAQLNEAARAGIFAAQNVTVGVLHERAGLSA
jgi:hypothetical protein